MFQIAPHFLSNNIWSWFNFHVFILEGEEGEEGQGRGGWGKWSMTKAYNLGLGFYIRSCSMFQKYWWWANQMACSGNKKKKPTSSTLTN
jgi:hypothetical protein